MIFIYMIFVLMYISFKFEINMYVYTLLKDFGPIIVPIILFCLAYVLIDRKVQERDNRIKEYNYRKFLNILTRNNFKILAIINTLSPESQCTKITSIELCKSMHIKLNRISEISTQLIDRLDSIAIHGYLIDSDAKLINQIDEKATDILEYIDLIKKDYPIEKVDLYKTDKELKNDYAILIEFLNDLQILLANRLIGEFMPTNYK